MQAWNSVKVPRPPSILAAERLKAALVDKLKGASGDKEVTQGLYKAITIVDKFLATSKGEGDIEQLKKQVHVSIAGKPESAKKPTPKAPVAKVAAAPVPITAASARSARSNISEMKPGLTTDAVPESVADWTLPPIVVERRARGLLNEYGRIALKKDDDTMAEDRRKKETIRAQQRDNRKALDSQQAYIAQQRHDELMAKRAEGEQVKESVRQWEFEMAEKARTAREKADKDKVERAAQVADVRARQKADKDEIAADDKRRLDEALAETARINRQKAEAKAENKRMLQKVQEDNIRQREIQLLQREKEKEKEIKMQEEYEKLLNEREARRLAELEKIAEMQRKKFEAGGGAALEAGMAEKAREDERRAKEAMEKQARLEDERARQKKEKQEEMTRACTDAVDEQLRLRAEEIAKEKAAKAMQARIMVQEAEELERKEKNAKVELKKQQRALHEKLVAQMKEDAKRRFLNTVDDMDERERKYQGLQLQGTAF